MKKLTSFIFLIELVNSFKIGLPNSSLNPGRIFWPKETWYSNPVELSQINAGSSITIIFNFLPSTSVTKGLVYLIFPSTFSTEPNTIVLASPNQINLQANRETSVTYSTALPSSPGIYGPFGIFTRRSTNGQIVDVNYAFSCVSITSSVFSSSSLIVSRTGTTTTINTENVLNFSFIISKTLWANDIIEIASDTWTPTTTVTCKSKITLSQPAEPNSSNSVSLPCTIATQSSSTTGISSSIDSTKANSVYMYGISQDIYIDSGSSTTYTVNIEIASFTAPGYVTSSSTWTVKIWRSRTNNLIAQYTTNSGIVTTSGNISIDSWEPVSTISTSDIMQGMTLFTKVTISIANPLTAGSTLTILFSGVDILNPFWWSELDGSEKQKALCYITSPFIPGADCQTTSINEATIKFAYSQVKTSISFAVLSYFYGSSPEIINVQTNKDYRYGAVVDQSFSQYRFIIKPAGTANYHMFSDLAFHALSHSGWYPSLSISSAPFPNVLNWASNEIEGGILGADLYFRIKPALVNPWGGISGVAAKLTFNFKKTSKFDNDNYQKVYIGSSITTQDFIVSSASLQSQSIGLVEEKAVPSLTPTIGTDSISVAFTNTNASPLVAVGHYYILRIQSEASTSLPCIASNKATFYEMWAKATYTVGSDLVTEIGSSVFSVFPRILDFNLQTSPVCNAKMDGIPIVNYFEPLSSYNIDFSQYDFALDIVIQDGYDEFLGFMGTGIMVDPITSSLTLSSKHFVSSFPDAQATLTTQWQDATITIKGFRYTGTGTPKFTTYFPSAVATLRKSQFATSTTFYYTKSNLKYIFYKTGTDSAYVDWNFYVSPTFIEDKATYSSGNAWRINSSSGVKISQQIRAHHNVYVGNIFGISLSKGFTFSGTPTLSETVSAVTRAADSVISLPSSSENALGGFILAKVGEWAENASFNSDIPYDVIVENLMPPNYAIGIGGTVWSVWISSWPMGNGCTLASSYSNSNIEIVPLRMTTDPTCSPKVVSGSGPDSVNTSGRFSFTTTVPVPAEGKIGISLENSWTWSTLSTSYTCNGFSCDKIPPLLSGFVLKITLDSYLSPGSYYIEFTGALPPGNSQASNIYVNCFTALYTQTSDLKEIEKWGSGGVNNQVTVTPASASGATSI